MGHTQTKSLGLGRLRLDGDTQPREKLDDQTVASYATDLETGEKLPAVDVFFDEADYWLADGFHRYRAHQKAKKDRIACRVHKGTAEDARWFALAANKTHGLRRTNADKARAVKRALAHPNGAKMSDKAIGDHVGVHFNTVAKHRHELSEDRTITKCDSRTGRDGRTINTANIGKKPADQTSQDADVQPAPPDIVDDENTLCSACGSFECSCYTEDNSPAEDEEQDDPTAELTDEQVKQVDDLYGAFRAFIALLGGAFSPEEWAAFERTMQALEGDFEAPVWREFARRIERYAIVMSDTEDPGE
ncbi:hypothetical protein LCGC14_1694900 [marine sediment metagenome]|uniref:ParB-like N-terminal domain-containing protein n=1 Tax=marine sediment metagenome TaxID=412755 RepID=A0A0F9HJL9_9ZZZZ